MASSASESAEVRSSIRMPLMSTIQMLRCRSPSQPNSEDERDRGRDHFRDWHSPSPTRENRFRSSPYFRRSESPDSFASWRSRSPRRPSSSIQSTTRRQLLDEIERLSNTELRRLLNLRRRNTFHYYSRLWGRGRGRGRGRGYYNRFYNSPTQLNYPLLSDEVMEITKSVAGAISKVFVEALQTATKP